MHKSTADNSLLTNQLAKGSDWLKNIIDYKNVILGPGESKAKPPGYLQTIESEEIVATEGC